MLFCLSTWMKMAFTTVVENMLTDVVGRAAYRNYNLNTNSSYYNYIMADGTSGESSRQFMMMLDQRLFL
jgi:hypothetical protein